MVETEVKKVEVEQEVGCGGTVLIQYPKPCSLQPSLSYPARGTEDETSVWLGFYSEGSHVFKA